MTDGFGVHAVFAVCPEALAGEADRCLLAKADQVVASFAEQLGGVDRCGLITTDAGPLTYLRVGETIQLFHERVHGHLKIWMRMQVFTAF